MGFLTAYNNYIGAGSCNDNDLGAVWDFSSMGASIPDAYGNGTGVFLEGPNPDFGTGFFSGDLVKIDNNSLLEGWSMFMSFSRSGTDCSIIVSTRASENGAGFSFGVSDTNVPFVYTNKDGEGQFRAFNSIEMSTYNTVCLMKGRDSVTLTVYHPSGNYTKSETVSVKNGSLGANYIHLGMDSFNSGYPFVGDLYEMALYQNGMVGFSVEELLSSGFSEYSGVAKIEGLVSNKPVLSGVSLGKMLSFEKANLSAPFSSALNAFYIDNRYELNDLRVFPDGVLDTDWTVDGNGVVVFNSADPTVVIYDIYTTGEGYEPTFASGGYFLNFGNSEARNSLYGSDGTLRLQKGVEYFEASEKDAFYGKRLGGVSAKSSNILCQK